MISLACLLFLQYAFVFGGRPKQRNDPCIVNGLQSRCTYIIECPEAMEYIMHGGPLLTYCSEEGFNITVCCPSLANETQLNESYIRRRSISREITHLPIMDATKPSECGVKPFTVETNLSPYARVARRKCHEYARAVYTEVDVNFLPGSLPDCIDTCNNDLPLIVQGEPAKGKELPHMASIGQGLLKNVTWVCGGTLISDKFIMSAAHCTNPLYGEVKWARLGELDSSRDDDDARPIILEIEKSIIHPEYEASRLKNDICLFELLRSIQFSPYIRPACLKVIERHGIKELSASGWGRTSYRGHPSGILLHVNLTVVPNDECNKHYVNVLSDGMISSKQMCAGQTGKDTCLGDSGGPLQHRFENPYCMYDVFGITSYGRDCGNGIPAVYTKVEEYVPWIVCIVWPNELIEEVETVVLR